MSNDPTVPPTQPTLETVLERINALDQNLRAEMAQVRSDLSTEIAQVRSALSADIAQVRTDLSTEIQSFREEVMEQFAQAKDRFEIMAEEWLEARGEQKRLRKRIDELERPLE